MSKATAPLLSFGASGQLGSTLVYGKWKGISYARRYVVPANPQSAEQTITRNCFAFLQSVYKVAPTDVVAPWTAYVKGKPLTERNAFTKFNLPGLRDQPDLTAMTLSPGALGGLPPLSLSAASGVGEAVCTITAPTTLPTGWTINKAVAAAIADQDPDTGVLFDIVAGSDASAAYEVTLTGLDAVLYQVRAWLVWNRPDGTLAYSPDVSDTVTPT